MTNIAVLGTGIMGAPIARHLVGAGHHVTVWNRTAAKAEALEADGCQVAADPAAGVAGADVVITMLSDGPATRSAMRAAAEALSPSVLWLQMATVGVPGSADLAALAAEVGARFVDAPVLGSKHAAEDGILLVLASGADADRPEVESLLAPVSRAVHWLGETGSGSRMKLVANSWVVGMTALLGETIGLADALDVDPAAFLSTIAGGPLDAGYAQTKGAAMVARQYPVQFPAKHAGKDARLCVEAARDAGVDLRVLAAVAAQFEAATGMGHGEEDMAAVREAVISAHKTL